MLQVIIWILCVYLVVKGVEVLVVALASPRTSRTGIIVLAGLTLGVCVAAAAFFMMASSTIVDTMPSLPSY